ncbi:MAG: DUF4143 domain-containing protein, partial [Deltaproteobacteria bacterium]|nr:DUF4143 domain-containing protein [Deltaproteobacteria bacterium]
NVLNLGELCRDAGISLPTGKAYLSVLEATFLVSLLPPYAAGRTPRLVKSSKVYMSDSGIAAHLAGAGRLGQDFTAEPLAGALLETHVLQNLRALLGTWCPGAGLYYWRIQGRYEVDFVIEHKGRVLAVEVKWAGRIRERDIKALERFMARVPGCDLAILACNVDQATSLGKGIFAVPLGLVLA